MAEYSEIKAIEELYNEEEISGKSYLFCVDNNIDTLQDLQKFIAGSSSCVSIPDDLLIFQSSLIVGNPVKDNIVDNDTNCVHPIDEVSIVKEYNKVYKIALEHCSVRTQNLLHKIEMTYHYPSISFFEYLQSDDLRASLKRIRGAGEKVYSEIKNIAAIINAYINGKHTSIDEYISVYTNQKKKSAAFVRKMLDVLEEKFNFPDISFFQLFLLPDIDLLLREVNNGICLNNNIQRTCRFQILKIRNELHKTHDISSILSLVYAHNEKNTNIEIYDNTQELSQDKDVLLAGIWISVNKLKSGLSVRCCNAVDKLIKEHSNSIVSLYNYLISPRFKSLDIKGIGKKSGEELKQFREGFLLLINDWLKNGEVDQKVQIIKDKLGAVVKLGESDISLVTTLYNTLNRIPLFKLIDCAIKQDKRAFTIISKSTRVYNGNTINVDAACDILELTKERVRQLRNKVFSDIVENIGIWAQHFDFSYYEQYCTASWDKERIYIDEGVDFSDDFIDIVSSILFRDNYTLIGDIQESMMSFYDRKEALFIVPNNFAKVFNFEKLLFDINEHITRKVYKDYQIDLNHHMLNYFNEMIRFDLIDQIMEYIRLMLFEKFQLVVNEGTIEIKKNANKSIPECIEEILEESGEIMSIDDIYDIFEAKHPGLTKNKTSFRASILRSDRVVSISRSGNYALKEWESKGIKTGTIKDIIYDYLLGFSTPQSLESIEKYVIQHRPSTDANSIYNNLLLDNRGLFELLSLDDERFVSIDTHSYGDEYVNIRENPQSTYRRTFQESIDALYNFVNENQRFPFTSSPSAEEMRLGRFLGIVRAKRSNGKLTEEEESILNIFEIDNIEKAIPNEQYKWNLRFKELEDHIIEYNRLPSSKHEPSLYTWFNKQRSNTNKGLLRNEDATKIRTLLELVT